MFRGFSYSQTPYGPFIYEIKNIGGHSYKHINKQTNKQANEPTNKHPGNGMAAVMNYTTVRETVSLLDLNWK